MELNNREVTRAIFIAAGERMRLQHNVPATPASLRENGAVELCTAGCIAFAGLNLISSSSDAASFERKLADNLDSTLIESAFEKIGWTKETCRSWMHKNDTTPENMRKSEMLKLLASASP